eukprot:2468216-Karenia_brevis.AAC.1
MCAAILPQGVVCRPAKSPLRHIALVACCVWLAALCCCPLLPDSTWTMRNQMGVTYSSSPLVVCPCRGWHR